MQCVMYTLNQVTILFCDNPTYYTSLAWLISIIHAICMARENLVSLSMNTSYSHCWRPEHVRTQCVQSSTILFISGTVVAGVTVDVDQG